MYHLKNICFDPQKIDLFIVTVPLNISLVFELR